MFARRNTRKVTFSGDFRCQSDAEFADTSPLGSKRAPARRSPLARPQAPAVASALPHGAKKTSRKSEHLGFALRSAGMPLGSKAKETTDPSVVNARFLSKHRGNLALLQLRRSRVESSPDPATEGTKRLWSYCSPAAEHVRLRARGFTTACRTITPNHTQAKGHLLFRNSPFGLGFQRKPKGNPCQFGGVPHFSRQTWLAQPALARPAAPHGSFVLAALRTCGPLNPPPPPPPPFSLSPVKTPALAELREGCIMPQPLAVQTKFRGSMAQTARFAQRLSSDVPSARPG